MSLSALALQFPDHDSDWSGEEHEAEEHETEAHEAYEVPAPSSPSLSSLRAQVATIVAGNASAGPSWPTGIHDLDTALGGGVPRGRVTEVVGTMGAGKTSLVRQLAARVLSTGGWVAWIDATRTLAPQELAGLGERLIVIRPREHTRGAWCADLLLRGGVFALVILDGAPVLTRTIGVRLSQLARERDAAFVVLREGSQGSQLGGAVRLRVRNKTNVHALINNLPNTNLNTNANINANTIANTNVNECNAPSRSPITIDTTPNSPFTPMNARRSWNEQRRIRNTVTINAEDAENAHRHYSVLVEKGGTYRTVEVNCAVVLARRVCTDSEIPDRRSVARRARVADESRSSQTHDQTTIAAAGDASAVNIVTHHTITAIDYTAIDATARQNSTRQGRGRPRMGESSYGRSSRRSEARRLLATREQKLEQQSRQRPEHRSEHKPKPVTAPSLGRAPACIG